MGRMGIMHVVVKIADECVGIISTGGLETIADRDAYRQGARGYSSHLNHGHLGGVGVVMGYHTVDQ